MPCARRPRGLWLTRAGCTCVRSTNPAQWWSCRCVAAARAPGLRAMSPSGEQGRVSDLSPRRLLLAPRLAFRRLPLGLSLPCSLARRSAPPLPPMHPGCPVPLCVLCSGSGHAAAPSRGLGLSPFEFSRGLRARRTGSLLAGQPDLIGVECISARLVSTRALS